jgi:hypothetical protein
VDWEGFVRCLTTVDGVANKYIMYNSAFSMDWEGYVRYPTMVDGIHIDAKN